MWLIAFAASFALQWLHGNQQTVIPFLIFSDLTRVCEQGIRLDARSRNFI